MEDKNKQTRREFLTKSALGVAGMAITANWLSSCSGKKMELSLPPLLSQAPDGKLLKAGLVGCGGRGTGAAINYLDAGPNLEIAALADVFEDRLTDSRNRIEKRMGKEIPDDKCFIGLEAYKKVIDSGVDVVILATPPYFRPLHFAACVDAHKHVFLEKPLGVDPVGIRSVLSTAQRADSLGLTVITGTQRHHQESYIEAYKRVMDGEIGEIIAANCYWNTGQVWYKTRREGWSDMEYMIRNWNNFSWLSGDHILDQGVHNIDVINWFKGWKFPKSANGNGSRHRRITGDQYDNFSIDYIYDGDVHMNAMFRQIDGCSNKVGEYVRGTKGYSNCHSFTAKHDGQAMWTYKKPENNDGENKVNSPYLQEHIHLVTAIRRNEPVNLAELTAKSTLTAIMGRIAAYSGKEVTWEEMMKSNLQLGPESGPENLTTLGSSKLVESEVPVPGTA